MDNFRSLKRGKENMYVNLDNVAYIESLGEEEHRIVFNGSGRELRVNEKISNILSSDFQ